MIENKIKKSGAIKILDAGCGLSFFPFFVKKEFPQCEVHGTDMDSSLVKTYENINNEIESEVIFNLGDLRNLDYPEKSFDIIYCISVLEHTENYKEIVDHFYRLLVPGGHLILTFDVSLDGDRTISVSDGQKLLDYLGSRFTPVYEATDIKSVINRRGEVLTTTYVATIDKNLLPWRSPWKNVLKNVLSLKKPKFIFELACYCQVFEKN
jgi:SAM-dependent methyltransferase